MRGNRILGRSTSKRYSNTSVRSRALRPSSARHRCSEACGNYQVLWGNCQPVYYFFDHQCASRRARTCHRGQQDRKAATDTKSFRRHFCFFLVFCVWSTSIFGRLRNFLCCKLLFLSKLSSCVSLIPRMAPTPQRIL